MWCARRADGHAVRHASRDDAWGSVEYTIHWVAVAILGRTEGILQSKGGCQIDTCTKARLAALDCILIDFLKSAQKIHLKTWLLQNRSKWVVWYLIPTNPITRNTTHRFWVSELLSRTPMPPLRFTTPPRCDQSTSRRGGGDYLHT